MQFQASREACHESIWKSQEAIRRASEARPKRKEMGSRGQDRLDLSPGRLVHQERCRNRPVAGFEEGLAQGTVFRNANAHVLYQSSGAWVECSATARTAKGKGPALEKDPTEEEKRHEGCLKK